MNNELVLLMACGAGMLLGGFFFGGLWWTVGKCLTSPHPAPWMLASGLVRMSVTLTGFYFVSGGQWQRLIACLVGFITARLIVTWQTRHRDPSVVVDEATSPFRQSHAGLVASSTTAFAESGYQKQETNHAS